MKTVLLDLDGTLTDPGRGITHSVAYALEHFGIAVPDRKRLYPYIGPPLLQSFQELAGLTPEQSKEALRLYRECFTKEGMLENELYPGIPELLRKLQSAGCRLVLATSKPEEYAVSILEHFGLTQYIDTVAGNNLAEARPDKTSVLRYAMELFPDIGAGTAWMVGDRKHDVEGAHAVGLPCVGVLYGYGSREELTSAGADALADSVEALEELLCRVTAD